LFHTFSPFVEFKEKMTGKSIIIEGRQNSKYLILYNNHKFLPIHFIALKFNILKHHKVDAAKIL